MPSAVPVSPAWAGGASGSNGVAAMEAEPSGPPDMGGKTFAQLQAEEERAARKAAKASAKQTAGSTAAAQRPPSAGGTAPAVPRPTPVVVQPAARAAVPVQQQIHQQPAAAAAAPTTAAGSRAAGPAGAGAAVATPAQASGKPALEQLGDELTALKGTLRPMIATLAAAKVCNASQDAEFEVVGVQHGWRHLRTSHALHCSLAPCALSLGWCCALSWCAHASHHRAPPQPICAAPLCLQSEAETRVAGTLQGHLHRFDDLFMQVQMSGYRLSPLLSLCAYCSAGHVRCAASAGLGQECAVCYRAHPAGLMRGRSLQRFALFPSHSLPCPQSQKERAQAVKQVQVRLLLALCGGGLPACTSSTVDNEAGAGCWRPCCA